MEDQRALAYLLALPCTLLHRLAQYLRPQAIGDTALLRIDAAPGHRPVALPGIAAHLFGQARLANTDLPHQEHTLRAALRIQRQDRRLLRARHLDLCSLLRRRHQVAQRREFLFASDERALVATTNLDRSR